MLSLADIVGAGSTVPLVSQNITARWIAIVFTGTGTARVGGASASPGAASPFVAGNGVPVNAAGAFFLPYSGPDFSYSMASVYVYLPVGLAASVSYEPFD
jgi:hypothetical protein